MISVPTQPSARASITEKADWAELSALAATDRNTSVEDFAGEYRMTGDGADTESEFTLADEDELGESPPEMLDRGGEYSLELAQSTFSELDDRAASTGGSYPFKVQSNYIQASDQTDRSLYCFLLLLRWFGINAIPARKDVAILFERVSMACAREYFGGDHAQSYRFGEPRSPDVPSGFQDALVDLSRRLGEGFGLAEGAPYHHTGDRGLDLVVWRPFPDNRSGKLMGFGQCATGSDWERKTSDLNLETFFGTWATPAPSVTPVRLFFVPFRVEFRHWRWRSTAAGILFDRCRIASFEDRIPESLLNECRLWSLDVLQELRQP